MWIKDAHAAKEWLVCALLAMQIIDGAIRCPCGKMGFFRDMADFVVMFPPAFKNVGAVNAEPTGIRCFTAFISARIGCPFVGVEAVKEVAVLHFPHVTSDVEFAKKGRVIACFAKVIGKEDFVLR